MGLRRLLGHPRHPGGYHQYSGSAHLFWPFAGYRIEGQTVAHWINPNNPGWQLFDSFKQRYDGGNDPPVVWVQICIDLNAQERNYAPATYDQVVTMLQLMKSHARSSMIFVSPLQAYDPPSLCPKMGLGGEEISTVTGWLDQAVREGLAYPGPGVSGIPNLGPLTAQNTRPDHCHPGGQLGDRTRSGSGGGETGGETGGKPAWCSSASRCRTSSITCRSRRRSPSSPRIWRSSWARARSHLRLPVHVQGTRRGPPGQPDGGGVCPDVGAGRGPPGETNGH